MPVLEYVACDPGHEEEEAPQFIEYIHMTKSLIVKG